MKISERKPHTYKHEWVSEVIRDLIATGVYKTGQQLPSLRDLSTMFGVTANTIREGLRPLIEDGTIDCIHGLGNFVAATAQQPVAKDLATTVEELTLRVSALEALLQSQQPA